jgi:hypothetical protein
MPEQRLSGCVEQILFILGKIALAVQFRPEPAAKAADKQIRIDIVSAAP